MNSRIGPQVGMLHDGRQKMRGVVEGADESSSNLKLDVIIVINDTWNFMA